MNSTKIIVILIILCPVLSLYNISINTTGMENWVYHKILYTRYIGRPIEILINDNIPIENKDFRYKNNYLYVRTKYSQINVVLVWDDSIGEGDIILDSTNSLIINDDNNITKESDNINQNTNEIFSDKNIIIKKTSRQEIMVKENTSEEIFTDSLFNDSNNEQRRLEENEIKISKVGLVKLLTDMTDITNSEEKIFIDDGEKNTISTTSSQN